MQKSGYGIFDGAKELGIGLHILASVLAEEKCDQW
jgi:hypothetical protein